MTEIRVLLLGNVDITSEMPVNMSSFLTHLDLGETGVHGDLPVSIFEKPNLQVLILAGNDGLTGSLPSFNRSSVSLIKELILPETSISGALPESITFMTNLNRMILSKTSISGRLPDSIGFMNNLNQLDISECKLSGPIPESIGNITDITEINLSSNEFSGEVPSTIANLRSLTDLDLSKNHLEGKLPDAFSGLQKLAVLSLGYNDFMGRIPSSFTNMSRLEWVDISFNRLTGFPSSTVGGLQKLSTFDLSNNLIKGMIPSWLLSLPSLVSLGLADNRLTGQIGKLNSQSLINLDLSNNQLNIELESFYNLSEIQHLFLSYNTITEHGYKVVNVTLPNLGMLELSSCEINEFPNFLRNLPGLVSLDLSNNKIHGPIPRWFSSLPWQDFSYLNLSNNYITYAGYLPWQQLVSLRYLDLHSNSLQGTLPSSVCNMSELSLLSLFNNNLRGKIPQCMGNFSYDLEVLDLRRNEFQGKIPTTVGGSNYALVNLGLNENHLEGPLPRSLANCTYLEVLDVGNNMIYDTFPWWLENLTQLKVLILKSNRFHGSIGLPVSNDSFSNLRIIDLSYNHFTGILPGNLFARLQALKSQDEAVAYDLYLGRNGYYFSMTLSVKGVDVELIRVLSIFTTIDLSNNNFEGHIPESITDLSSLRLLNLSHNSINGSIPRAIGHMTKLEQLDLSNNQLMGWIPQTLTNLTFLAVLNLSHNHLTGPIPESNQFPTFSNDSYVGNLGLCGAPLTKSCGDDEAPPSPEVIQEEDDSGFMMGFTWKPVAMGYGCGIVLGFILGNVMISVGKPKWLARFVNQEAAIWLNKRKKRGRVLRGRR